MTAIPEIISQIWHEKDLKSKTDEIETDELMQKALSVAHKELREEKSVRENALRHLKEWLSKNPDVENVRSDDNFLLRFLRTKKFSIPMAEQMILKYLNLRQTMPNYFYNLDYLSPKLNQLINNGFCFASPYRDAKGRRIVFTIMRNFDPYKYSSVEMAKLHCLAYESFLDEEETQIFGFNHIGDGTGVSPAMVTIWSPTEFATLFKWGEQSYPMRHKEVHIVNLLPAVKYVVEFARSRVSPKMKDRLTVHDNWGSVCKKVDPKCLPKEYGGIIPQTVMIEMFKRHLDAKRDKMLALDKMKLLSDQGIICRKNKQHHAVKEQSNIQSLSGSFRRLEVD